MKEQENLKTTVLKLYNAGSKVSDIVTQTGVPRSTAYYWIKNGIPKEMSPLSLRDYHFLKQKCERQEKIIAILKSAPCADEFCKAKSRLQSWICQLSDSNPQFDFQTAPTAYRGAVYWPARRSYVQAVLHRTII